MLLYVLINLRIDGEFEEIELLSVGIFDRAQYKHVFYYIFGISLKNIKLVFMSFCKKIIWINVK